MDSKKKRMIEVSLKLFSEKGFHSTSIQEIADQSDVSKGAFYLHFDSKDDLFVEIYKYYTETVLQKLSNMHQETGNPFDQFTKQVSAFLQLFKEHKEYLMMHFRENVHLGDKKDELILNLHKQSYDWMEDRLINIYGEEIKPYIVDAIILTDGVMSGYFKWIAIHDLSFDPDQLAGYITKNIDILVQGILTNSASPVFQYQDLKRFKQRSDQSFQAVIEQIKSQITDLERGERQQIEEALHVLEEEWQKQEPKQIIIQSMIEHLESYATIKPIVQSLKKYV
ncbi:TetR/AcrR family transcriptional regulator [Gracilibacillus thailandensis]|uniref:TetR family transcriptional regulator n=1 Tax=Gracilibacillus thailandensis TaxID=563735 RepID=A0A6N7R3Z1_9BACI|nr:TetR/AcrR family transcriptional regulator [Gracilibacillus thailandensis]MRI67932.1 TetR family transcriptional regulator [Gracilibacillus thailandensis]